MYLEHFNLTERPFSITPDPRFLYMSARHREALAHLLYGLGDGGGFVQLTAPNLHAMGLMTNRDFENYSSLFQLMESFVKGPDLLIYLRSSIPNLVAQIHKRGRDYENTISIDYLSRLNERYEAWISKYDKGNLLIIDVDNLDFVTNPEDLGDIINKIDAQINGLL